VENKRVKRLQKTGSNQRAWAHPYSILWAKGRKKREGTAAKGGGRGGTLLPWNGKVTRRSKKFYSNVHLGGQGRGKKKLAGQIGVK